MQCHANATCTNRAHEVRTHAHPCTPAAPIQAICECTSGYFGNGRECYDIDECAFTVDMLESEKSGKRREQIKKDTGACGRGTRCINTSGSFECRCLPGYAKILATDKYCVDLLV